MVARFLLFVLVGGASACGGPRHDAGDDALMITVMSFNVRVGTADDGPDSWSRRRFIVFELLREEMPDVVGLQEALRFQLNQIRANVRGYAESGVGRDDGVSGGEHAAILYRAARWRVDEQGTFWFSDTPDVAGSRSWGNRAPRICTWTRLVERGSERAFYVYNVHWDHESQPSRERSAELLMQQIRARRHADPVIVTGDFNADEDNPAFRQLLDPEAAPRLVDTFRALHPEAAGVIGTSHYFRGSTTGPKIDAVLASDDWRVLDAAIVHFSRDGRYPSDHFPVTTRLALGGR